MKTPTTVRAVDLMQKTVITLAADSPIQEAAEILEDSGVHGVPVTDGGGHIVGILSVTDIARAEHMKEGGVNANPGDADFVGLSSEAVDEDLFGSDTFPDREDYSPEMLGRQTVGEWMTPRVVSVAPDATLKEICRVMMAEGIHRVLVLEKGKLRGIVSSTDIVRHLAES